MSENKGQPRSSHAPDPW